jgi:hypothetical protein
VGAGVVVAVPEVGVGVVALLPPPPPQAASPMLKAMTLTSRLAREIFMLIPLPWELLQKIAENSLGGKLKNADTQN